jgi:transcriptional regulator with XRE-family HTH domain
MQVKPSPQAGRKPVKTFGERLRELRRAKSLSQRALAERVGVNFTYLSRCETGTLDFAQYPSEDLIRRLAAALEADEDELLILARKVPPVIRERVFERPDVFGKLARLDDARLDHVVAEIDRLGREGKKRRKET